MNKEKIRLNGSYLRAYIGLVIFSLVYVLPIIIANFYYIDDLGRSLEGNTGWKGNGRPLADWVAIILSDGKPLMDVSPWIQILSVVTLDYVLILFVKKLIPMASAFQLFIVASFAYLNLFMLENLSYKFDSFGMIVSLGIFLLLYSLPDKNVNRKFLCLSSSLAVLLSLSIYQASVGAYISLAVLEVIYFLYQKSMWRDIMERVALRVLGILTGGLVYKLIIANRYVDKHGYSAEHSSFLNPFSSADVSILIDNLASFGNMFRDYGLTLGVLGILLLLVLYIGLGIIAKSIWRNREDTFSVKVITIFFLMISPVVFLLAAVAFLAMLRAPIFAPRVMMSFTVFTLFTGLVIYYLSESGGWLGEKTFFTLGVLVLVGMLSFSSYYGNLLTRQEKINSLVATFLVYDINEVEQNKGHKAEKLAFVGHSPKCKELLLANKKRPLYDRLIPVYMNNGWIWGSVYLEHLKKEAIKFEPEADDRDYTNSIKPVKTNEYYELYWRGDKLIAKFMGS